MERIGTEIHQDLMHLGRISKDGPSGRFYLLVDRDGRRQRRTEQIESFLDNMAGFQGNLFYVGLTAEGKDLLNQGRCPLAGLLNFA